MDPVMAAGAVASGAGVGVLVRAVMTLPPGAPGDTPLERRRRAAVRRRSWVYANFEDVVFLVAGWYRRLAGPALARATTHLDALGEDEWKPEEYLAAAHVAVLPGVAVVGAGVGAWFGPLAGVAAAALILVVAPLMTMRSLRQRAAARVKRVRGQLPYTLDLMALVLEAGGGTLFDCLRLGSAENEGHPLGDEFRRVVHGIEKGAPPADALGEMTRRLADPDVAEVGLAISTSETRGLPLKEALRAVAGRLRTRQVQWLEKASEQAKVHITWPAMLVMLGCLLIVAAPMVLAAGGQ